MIKGIGRDRGTGDAVENANSAGGRQGRDVCFFWRRRLVTGILFCGEDERGGNRGAQDVRVGARMIGQS